MRNVFPLLLVALVVLPVCGRSPPSDEPATQSVAARGEALYTERACASCHTVDGSKLVGPTWKGLAGSQVELADGSKVRADETYLRESMLQPSAKTVKGFPAGLMETVIKPNSLIDEEVDALIAYIKTLR